MSSAAAITNLTPLVQIRAAGYDGGYSRVTDFVRAWRQAEARATTVKAFVPLAFELGEAA